MSPIGPLRTLSAARLRLVLGLGLLGVLALALTLAATIPGLIDEPRLRAGALVAVGAAATMLLSLRVAWVDDERTAWSAFTLAAALACAAWALDLMRAIEPAVGERSASANALRLGVYLASALGFVVLALLPAARVGELESRADRRRRLLGPALDGLVGGLTLSAVVAATSLPLALGADGATGPGRTVMVAGAIGDMLLLIVLMTACSAQAWRLSRATWALFGAGIALVVVDTATTAAIVRGGLPDGNIYEPLWAALGLLMAAGGWQPTTAWNPPRRESHVLLGLPFGFGGLALAVLLVGERTTLAFTAIALAVLALVALIARMVLLARNAATLMASEQLSLTDDLTGLGNRRAFAADAAHAVRRATAFGHPLALLMLDLDQFKELNDTLGHDAGDELLRAIGPRLQDELRSDDVIARLGGDEFGVLLPGSGTDHARATAERLREALSRPFELGGIALHIGASVGIAAFPEHAKDAEALVRRADIAMYATKRARTGHGVYAPEGDPHSRDKLALAGELRRALAEDELEVHFQPTADLATGELLGVEALVRWRHPERGLLMPGEFLPAIEQTDLMRDLSRRVLAMSICQAGAWQIDERNWRTAVNLSATDLLDRRLVDDISALLSRYGARASLLTVELTESVLLTDPTRAFEVLAELRALGVRIALDDFGTGYSSLTHLRALPVDELKIDRSFIAAMTREPRAAAIVASTVDLAHAIGLHVVAEGIEDPDTWARVREVGCDAVQGYLLSAALPGPELEARADELAQRAYAATHQRRLAV